MGAVRLWGREDREQATKASNIHDPKSSTGAWVLTGVLPTTASVKAGPYVPRVREMQENTVFHSSSQERFNRQS
jgi:hypothetical protein